MAHTHSQGGFIKLILFFVVFATVVWYLKIDVRGFIDSHPQIKTFIGSLWEYLQAAWSTYLSGIWSFIWNTIIVATLWKGILVPIFELLPKP